MDKVDDLLLAAIKSGGNGGRVRREFLGVGKGRDFLQNWLVFVLCLEDRTRIRFSFEDRCRFAIRRGFGVLEFYLDIDNLALSTSSEIRFR